MLLTPFLSSVFLVFRIPPVIEWTQSFEWEYFELFIGIGLVSISLFVYYVQVGIPYITSERIAKSRWKAVDKLVENFVKDFKEGKDRNNRLDISVNIMIPKRRYLVSIEPKLNNPEKTKLSLFTDVFEILWRNNSSVVHNKFRMTVNQGVCGPVYKAGEKTKIVVLTREWLDEYESKFKFTVMQKEQTQHLKLIASCSITRYIYDNEAKIPQTVGVLNIESTDKRAFVWGQNKDNLGLMAKAIEELEEIVRHLI